MAAKLGINHDNDARLTAGTVLFADFVKDIADFNVTMCYNSSLDLIQVEADRFITRLKALLKVL